MLIHFRVDIWYRVFSPVIVISTQILDENGLKAMTKKVFFLNIYILEKVLSMAKSDGHLKGCGRMLGG